MPLHRQPVPYLPILLVCPVRLRPQFLLRIPAVPCIPLLLYSLPFKTFRFLPFFRLLRPAQPPQLPEIRKALPQEHRHAGQVSREESPGRKPCPDTLDRVPQEAPSHIVEL